MSAYLIGDIEIKDEKALERYLAEVPGQIAKAGGKYIVSSPTSEVTEGSWKPKHLVVLEFPTMESLKKWYDSEEYRPHRAQRARATLSNVVLVNGA